MMKLSSLLASLVLTVMISLVATHAGQKPGPGNEDHDPQIGQSFQVPYRLTDTNHFLVRVRINGKGPFNFLVDSGAPALYVATETAAKAGLKPVKGEFWTVIDRLDLEGGARLPGIKARVEDPFQLVGMNALGLPGASIDGILGFTILARFRLEIDPTRDSMTWTRLNHAPADPPVPRQGAGDGDRPPPELQVMNALGPLAKGLAFLMGKQPEEERYPRGFLGLEWAETRDALSGQSTVRISRVVAGSPAAQADIQAGDRLIRACGRSVTSLKAARAALSAIQAGNPVELTLRRGNEQDKARELTVTITAGEGL
ncbi:MAG: PDZ domain-containing protein [Isosphaeraceae bacterium]